MKPARSSAASAARKCGGPVSGIGCRPTPNTLPSGERRQLTVLFCDLVGSTPLSQQLDAEEWRDLIAQYQQAAASAVVRFGGHVAKNLGAGLLIYFGWPTAPEDDPERAVRAGLAIVEAVRASNERLHPSPPPFAEVLTGGGDRSLPPSPREWVPSAANISVSGGGSGRRPLLSVRVGMHTGPVVIADGGEVFGETANVAARVLLLATARPEFTPPWPARSNLTTVQLARLTKRQARAEELGFPFYLEWGRVLRGFARVQSGEGEAGIAEMQQALVELAGIGSGIGAPQILFVLAEGLRKVERHDDALGAIGLGVAQAEQQGQHFYDAELHRLRAEILLDMDGDAVEEAEALFVHSLEIARRQEAKTFELRAATSLARLWQRQGKPDAARALLAPLYAWFTEGFDTKNLKDAQALLADLG